MEIKIKSVSLRNGTTDDKIRNTSVYCNIEPALYQYKKLVENPSVISAKMEFVR